MRFGWKLVFATAAIVGATTLFGGAAATQASTPPSQIATVPAVGQTTTLTWTGTIAPGTDPASDCSAVDGTPQVDDHTITVQPPATGYTGIETTFTFSITWTPSSPQEDTSDEILTVANENTDTEVGNSDTGDTTEVVTGVNLGAGNYTAMACGFVNALPQDYTGKLKMETVAFTGTGGLPSADPQGLQFSAAVPADPQRDEAEPLIVSDKAGLLYTCGPTGFTASADYAQVSTDGGDQFHLLGTPPRGQQAIGGGGDCAVATGEAKNTDGNYQYAYTGLGALSGFTTASSPDNGHTLIPGGFDVAGGVTDEGGGADRQWMTFTDAQTVLLSYNQQQPRNIVVLQSTDGGQTYSPTAAIAAPDPDFPGPMHYIPTNHTVVMPWTKGGQVNLAISSDNGTTWTDCEVAPTDAAGSGTAGFATADVDDAGNVYVAWADKTDYHTWLAALPAAKVPDCNESIANVQADANGQPNVKPGWTPPMQMDRNKVRTTVFPWVAAGGVTGRATVAFYGTESDGDPNTSSFKAAWNVYASQTLNVFGAGRNAAQVQVTTHPFHYDSICLNGLGCDIDGGDRSMADFFAITENRKDGRLSIVFNRTNKKPDDAAGYVATPMVATQVSGPSNGGGTVGFVRPVLNTSTTDPAGDALYPYSSIGSTPDPMNVPSGDFKSVAIGNDDKTGGVTVTMKLADLSGATLAADAGNGSLVWVWRFTNGWQDAGAVAKWDAANGFTYGFDDYTTGSAECASSGDKCEIYPGATPIAGKVDQTAGTITLVVPKSVLHPLEGVDNHGRPTQTNAVVGSRFYDGTAFSFKNDSPDPSTQSWMAQLDNTPAFDFLLPTGTVPPGGVGRDRLVIDRVGLSPGAIENHKPVKLTLHISDTSGDTVNGALVYVRGVPANRIEPLKEQKTNETGWVDFKLTPKASFKLEHGGLITLFVRARLAGQKVIGGSSTRRLISLKIVPGGHVKAHLSPVHKIIEPNIPKPLVISHVSFTPRSISGTSPLRIHVFVIDSADGKPKAGALVKVIGVPFGRVTGAPEGKTGKNGRVTITLRPRYVLPSRSLLTFFIRARIEGQPLLAGASTRRLVALRVR
jgi:5-hydroxyisourate hydrolase-like protein (transthyretin family)